MTPEELAARPPLHHKAKQPKEKRQVTLQPPVQDAPPVMGESWDSFYESSPAFSTLWQATHQPDEAWPQGVHLHHDRLVLDGKLCIPEALVPRVLWEFHTHSGHLGAKRMMQEVVLRYHIPPDTHPEHLVQDIRSTCTIFQSTQPPHWPKNGQIEHFPIPERAMLSICLDVFSMPPTQWEEMEFDSILLAVDRLSGWIVAIPTLKVGLTAEKAMQLMWERVWELFGIPTTIHSDMGPQFVGLWF